MISTMKSTERYNHSQGSVWLAKIYFKEIAKYKIRPVIVVNNELLLDDLDVIIAPITSREFRNEFDVVLEHWQDAGLEKPSVTRISKITSTSKMFLTRKLGNLHQEDLERVLKMCKGLF